MKVSPTKPMIRICGIGWVGKTSGIHRHIPEFHSPVIATGVGITRNDLWTEEMLYRFPHFRSHEWRERKFVKSGRSFSAMHPFRPTLSNPRHLIWTLVDFKRMELLSDLVKCVVGQIVFTSGYCGSEKNTFIHYSRLRIKTVILNGVSASLVEVCTYNWPTQ